MLDYRFLLIQIQKPSNQTEKVVDQVENNPLQKRNRIRPVKNEKHLRQNKVHFTILIHFGIISSLEINHVLGKFDQIEIFYRKYDYVHKRVTFEHIQ